MRHSATAAPRTLMATASLPRRTGRGMESEAAAADRGATDRAIVAVLFQGGLRRSEAAALRWGDVQDAARRPRHRGLRPPVENRSGRHRGGRALPQARLRRRASPAPRPAHRAAIRVAPGRHRPGARRHQRPVHRTAPHGSGQRRRHRGANHRALRARRPRRRIDQARRTGAGDRPRRAGGSRAGWLPTTAPP